MDKLVYIVHVADRRGEYVPQLSYVFTSDSLCKKYCKRMTDYGYTAVTQTSFLYDDDKPLNILLSPYKVQCNSRGDIECCYIIDEAEAPTEEGVYVDQTAFGTKLNIYVCAISEVHAKVQAEEMRREYIKDRFNLCRRNYHEETY